MWLSFPLSFQGKCKSTNNSITFLSINLSHEKWRKNTWKGKKHSSKNLHKELCFSIESSIESDLVEKGKKGQIKLDIFSLNINSILKKFEHLKEILWRIVHASSFNWNEIQFSISWCPERFWKPFRLQRERNKVSVSIHFKEDIWGKFIAVFLTELENWFNLCSSSYDNFILIHDLSE